MAPGPGTVHSRAVCGEGPGWTHRDLETNKGEKAGGRGSIVYQQAIRPSNDSETP